ncbi:adhesion G-protein coupled receptor F2 isoform X2 [Pangasianodon hypophthalmus]|nr:adhesion G-protein coupled receptor F2 isoform X2 [Pangasianodon hypophthalmus]
MHPECCQNKTCATVLPGAMCLYKDRVLVNGSFTIQKDFYEFSDELRTYLTTSLTSVYSTMNWFDSLSASYREGSIIGDFAMLINGPFIPEQLVNKTEQLSNMINATFTIVTTGFIQISAPHRIGYHKFANVTCTTPVELESVKWYLQKGAQKQTVTYGTEANVSQDSRRSMVFVNQTSEVWKGNFICDYTSIKSSNIIHRASVYMDVALLPQIFITSNPQFPDCKTSTLVTVEIMCIIDNSTETYSVTWWPEDFPKQKTTSVGNTTSYRSKISIDCTKKQDEYNVGCIFTNRENDTRNATLKIPVIYDNSVVCAPKDDWPQAKANFSAKLQCNPNEIGFKSRECSGSTNKGEWGPINSQCVNTDIWTLLTEAQNLQRGCGLVRENANSLFSNLKTKSENQIINTFPNINASVNILDTLHNASEIQNSTFNKSMLTDFMKTSSNLLNDSLLINWKDNDKKPSNQTHSLAVKYLSAIEGFVNRIETTMDEPHTEENVQLLICNISVEKCSTAFNITFPDEKEKIKTVYQTRINNLPGLLPKFKDNDPSEFLLSVTAESVHRILIEFPTKRLPNHQILCLHFNFTTSEWSTEGCSWGGVHKPNLCECNHLSVFTSLMSKKAVELMYMTEITKTGLVFSICSLVLCLAIEFVVWNTVVKSNISHFRHTVLVNITLCLLVAHCSFLAASSPGSSANQWCLALTVMKHFCFLAVFFWMLCMSMGLLHQMIFVFVQLRKKVYLGLCFSLGYICPLLIVICAIITYDNGAADSYYVNETCWLKYESVLRGSIHTFVIPVGVIVLVNMFTMVVVISRILKPTLSEGKTHDEKEIVRSVIRTVVLLTPTLGITWIFGFFVLTLDLTMAPLAQIVNYGFTFFNSFQGFFILLTGCFGEKKVREALLMRIRPRHSAHYTSKSSMTMTAAVKKQ